MICQLDCVRFVEIRLTCKMLGFVMIAEAPFVGVTVEAGGLMDTGVTTAVVGNRS